MICTQSATDPAAPSPQPNCSRRRFVALTATALAGLAMPAARAAETPGDAQESDFARSDANWIDAHVHVWTPDTERYPLAPGFEPADMQPPSFTPEQLFAHCRPVGVNRIVLIQMSYYGFDNRYMLDTIAAHPETFVGVGIVDPQAAEVRETVRDLAQRGVRGLRIHPRSGEAARWTEDAAMRGLWQTARDQGIAVCPLINPSDLPHVQAMCEQFPGLTVVVDHFARIGIDGSINESQLAALCALARYPDVYVKTSAFYALGKKRPPYTDLGPMIRRVLDAFGPQRLMWASDCPFQVEGEHSYQDSIALIRDRLDFLSAADKEAMLRGTAESVFFKVAGHK